MLLWNLYRFSPWEGNEKEKLYHLKDFQEQLQQWLLAILTPVSPELEVKWSLNRQCSPKKPKSGNKSRQNFSKSKFRPKGPKCPQILGTKQPAIGMEWIPTDNSWNGSTVTIVWWNSWPCNLNFDQLGKKNWWLGSQVPAFIAPVPCFSSWNSLFNSSVIALSS